MKKLKVGKSKIAGKGLFTTDAFEQGEMIGLAHENDQPSTFIGKYHNHSDEPNAVNVKLGDKRYLMAKRALKKGEEITTNYRLQPELEQPEEFEKKKGGSMTPQKDGYRTYSPFKNLPYIDVESDTIDSDNIVYDLNLQADNGLSKFIEKNTGLHTLPGAKVIREVPVKRKGGLVKMPKPSKQGLASKKFSRSLEATNRLFTEDYLFSKPKSKKNKVFDPNAKYENGGFLPMAEYGMPMGAGMSQNYQGRTKFIHQDGGITFQDEYAAGGAASPLDLDPETMQKYLTTLKNLENNVKKGYKNNKWYPHPSVEGGADTIAYGHKLLPGEKNLYQGITEEQASALQQKDVLAKQAAAKNIVDKKYGSGTFDGLPQESQMLLVDYQYNVAGGLNKFPSFVDGVVTGDKAKMMREYERGSSAGKLTTRNNWTKGVIEGLDYTKPKTVIEENIPLANVTDATTVVLPQVEEPKLQNGGNIISQQGWDYMKEGDKYLTRRAGAQDWIEAQGKPLQAIKQNVFQEVSAPTTVAPITPVVGESTQSTAQPASENQEVLDIQKKLKEAGYDLGNYGVNKDGIDGLMGNRTKLAYDAYKANIPPKDVKVPKATPKPTLNYTVNRNLPDGYLPVMQGYGQEVCNKTGCSANVSIKMENLLGTIADGSLWANDAWFNKSDVLNKGGDLIYDSSSKNYKEMGKVPKEVYSKLQVGDYVQLNRTDTASSGKFAAQTKDGLQNEQIEHLGFVVGKDKDGTPLIWHGSETGKAFIKRIDEPISLDDHDKNTFTYKVSSIVRSPNLKDVDFSGLQNSPYYTPVDPNKKLVPKKGATQTQVLATQTFNNSIGQFKNLGYSQDDANYIGQILIGGIMKQETKGNEDWKAPIKQTAAYLIKDVAGIPAMDIPGTERFNDGKPLRTPGVEFEGDQASVGIYQMKPDYNFKTKDGELNPLGRKLQKLGFEVSDITSDNIQAQTMAGTLILLDNYKKLKENPDFDSETNLYKGKIPASYILAKSWQAGSGWESREKYQKFLNNLDVDYSNNALSDAANFIGVSEGMSIDPELAKVQQQQAALRAKQAEAKKKADEAKRKAAFAEQQKYQALKGDTIRKLPTVAESTAVNTIYNQRGPKPFDAASYIAQGPSKTIYTYSGRPGAMYKKDDKGNWYINLGSQTGNQFVKIDDKDGSRSAILNKSAVPSASKKYSQGGGIYMELTDSEIEQFRRGGYVIEDLD